MSENDSSENSVNPQEGIDISDNEFQTNFSRRKSTKNDQIYGIFNEVIN